MFISALELFKIGIGPSSSHTLGPMKAAGDFVTRVAHYLQAYPLHAETRLRCVLKGSLAYTGKGHGSDRAVVLGLHGHRAEALAGQDIGALLTRLWDERCVHVDGRFECAFTAADDILFDQGEALPEHPNGMIFELCSATGEVLLSETYFSIGGGFVSTAAEIGELVAPLKLSSASTCPYPFDSAASMLQMAADSGLSIAQMKRANECAFRSAQSLDAGLDAIWRAMRRCVEQGLQAHGTLPGGLSLPRRAGELHDKLSAQPDGGAADQWLCAYAMAVNEENAAGHMVVTAPTNGAAGVIPAVLYQLVVDRQAAPAQVHDFLLTAAAIGGLIKHRSSISGAEVGCQGEVGSAASMAAAGLCAVRGGSPGQVENAAEIALEHHLGMTCDPVNGLVQVPCIERNGFGAIKASAAASLAMLGSGTHYMPLDSCIAAMKQTGLEMSHKFKETSLGGLAVSITEC